MLGAPVSSNCSKQCVSDPPDNLEIVDPMDGCGLMGDHRVCALQNHLTCRSFEDVQKLYIEPNGPWVAVCTVRLPSILPCTLNMQKVTQDSPAFSGGCSWDKHGSC